jgi:hypothetical protein
MRRKDKAALGILDGNEKLDDLALSTYYLLGEVISKVLSGTSLGDQ